MAKAAMMYLNVKKYYSMTIEILCRSLLTNLLSVTMTVLW